MPTPPDKPTRRRWPWAAMLVVLVIVYPLSAGPVWFVFDEGFLPVTPAVVRVYNAFYAPVSWVMDRLPKEVPRDWPYSLEAP